MSIKEVAFLVGRLSPAILSNLKSFQKDMHVWKKAGPKKDSLFFGHVIRQYPNIMVFF